MRVGLSAAVGCRELGSIATDCRRRNSMAGPFIFIATNRLKAGKLDAERNRVPGLIDFIEANEPRLIAFNEYVNDEGTEVGVVQVHPDTDSFEFHMGGVRERAARAYQHTLHSTTRTEIFRAPTETTLHIT